MPAAGLPGSGKIGRTQGKACIQGPVNRAGAPDLQFGHFVQPAGETGFDADDETKKYAAFYLWRQMQPGVPNDFEIKNGDRLTPCEKLVQLRQ